MNAMWEKIIKDAEIALYDEKPVGYFLPNVKYFTGKEIDQEKTTPLSIDQSQVLYFSNTTLIKGLLYQGGIHKSLYALEDPKWFKNFLRPSATTMISNYEDVIKDNNKIMWVQVGVHDLSRTIIKFLRCQELLNIHKAIEARQMTYLNIQHEEAMLNLLYDGSKTIDKNLEAIDTYLNEQQKTYASQQIYWGPWIKEVFWDKQWKK